MTNIGRITCISFFIASLLCSSCGGTSGQSQRNENDLPGPKVTATVTSAILKIGLQAFLLPLNLKAAYYWDDGGSHGFLLEDQAGKELKFYEDENTLSPRHGQLLVNAVGPTDEGSFATVLEENSSKMVMMEVLCEAVKRRFPDEEWSQIREWKITDYPEDERDIMFAVSYVSGTEQCP